ncbi:MAG: MTH1187 family thiamine-binding protein [Chloroflexota bacterium]|nr:MAG: MTH1187 family thiamine-binding protein [Chloroflexota bacterium]
MKERVVAEVSIIPVGTSDTGLSRYIASCLEVLEGSKDLTYRLTPMGTIIEGPLDELLEVLRKMHEVPFSKGASRVVTHLKIDDRRDKPVTMANKVESVLKLRPSTKT